MSSVVANTISLRVLRATKAVRGHLCVGDWDRVLRGLLPDLRAGSNAWVIMLGLANHPLNLGPRIYAQQNTEKLFYFLNLRLYIIIWKLLLRALILVEQNQYFPLN